LASQPVRDYGKPRQTAYGSCRKWARCDSSGWCSSGPKQLFLVASVDLVGDTVESRVAHTLRRLEQQLQGDPYIIDAVLTVAEPDELDEASYPA